MNLQEEADKTSQILRKGGVIVYPTDTIWGIGCDAENFEAVERIYHIKERSDTKSMLILVSDKEMLKKYINSIPDVADKFINQYGGPLTIIYPHARLLPANLVSSDQTIGIRITSDDFCRKLLKSLGRPIVSTSANISGQPHPSFFREISPLILEKADYVVQYRQDDTTPSAPSRIIKIELSGNYTIIR